jgi:hypothetical protein
LRGAYLEERRRGRSATRESGRGDSICGERESTRRRRRAASAAEEQELLFWRVVWAAARRMGKTWWSKEAEEGEASSAAASSMRPFLFLLFPFRFMAFGCIARSFRFAAALREAARARWETMMDAEVRVACTGGVYDHITLSL